MAERAARPDKAQRAHATKALAARRVDDVLRIRLDGAEFWDLREFVREKEGEDGSAWLLAPGEGPLSDSQIRRYQSAADRLIEGSTERSRKRLLRRHAAKRRNLYAKAVLSADYRTALSCLRDEAELLGLYPGTKHTLSGPKGGDIPVKVKHDLAELLPSQSVILAFLRSADDRLAGDGGAPGEVREDGEAQPVDPVRPVR